MIDIHCHIIPCVDDGPGSIEKSLLMADIAQRDGISNIVATPHTLNGTFMNSGEDIIAGVTSLQNAFMENNIDIRLHAGADIHICPGMLERVDSGDALTINNKKKYILLELPAQTIPVGIKDEIYNLKTHGITSIITHPERHPIIEDNLDMLADLIRIGALCQITAMSVTGDFGERIKKCSEKLIRNRMAHIIATDAHSPNGRPPFLSYAVEAAAEILGNYNEAEAMVTHIPATIISGDPVDIPEPKL